MVDLNDRRVIGADGFALKSLYAGARRSPFLIGVRASVKIIKFSESVLKFLN